MKFHPKAAAYIYRPAARLVRRKHVDRESARLNVGSVGVSKAAQWLLHVGADLDLREGSCSEAHSVSDI